MTDRPFVRVRTAKNKDKALQQYQEMRRAGRVTKAMVIVEHPDGNLTVLGQMLTPLDMAPMLGAAALGVRHAMDKLNEARPQPHDPAEGAAKDPARKPLAKRRMVTQPDGTLAPPPGETMIRCGECDHPRWYITLFEATETPARFSCAHCGNEVQMTPIHPVAGNA